MSCACLLFLLKEFTGTLGLARGGRLAEHRGTPSLRAAEPVSEHISGLKPSSLPETCLPAYTCQSPARGKAQENEKCKRHWGPLGCLSQGRRDRTVGHWFPGCVVQTSTFYRLRFTLSRKWDGVGPPRADRGPREGETQSGWKEGTWRGRRHLPP